MTACPEPHKRRYETKADAVAAADALWRLTAGPDGLRIVMQAHGCICGVWHLDILTRPESMGLVSAFWIEWEKVRREVLPAS